MPPTATNSVFVNAFSKLLSIIVLIGLSLAVFAYRRSLEPLYASAPVELHFGKVLWLACILGSFSPTLPIWPVTLIGGVLLLAMPQTAYWVAVYTGRMGDPVWGPVVTNLVVIAPVIALGVAIVKALQQTEPSDNNVVRGTETSQQIITLPICHTAITAISELWSSLPYTTSLPEHQILLQLGTLAVVAWSASPFFPALIPDKGPETPKPNPAKAVDNTPPKTGSQRRKARREEAATATPPAAAPASAASSPKTPPASKNSLFLRVALVPLLPFLTSTILRPPTLSKPLLEPYVHPSYPLRILSSAPSRFSSVVVVGEALPLYTTDSDQDRVHSLRYLRAGHSLLGGVYIGDLVHTLHGKPVQTFDETGTPLGDSIYSTFVLQEAAQLVDNSGKEAEQKRALFIGLGAGISASAFMRNNINSTIIEIDPAVYEASKRFFGLPTRHLDEVAVLDANLWVRRRQTRLENATAEAAELSIPLADDKDLQLFDIVIHDCFSGGGLPGHLFTQEHFTSIKAIMQPDGIVAVNSVGPMTSDSTRAIALTLTSVFAQCRVFYDSTTNSTHEAIEHEHINWIFFCSPSPEPITFRIPREAEFLGSPLRRHMLTKFREREIDIREITESVPEDKIATYVLTHAHNPLSVWQKKDAINHWKIMRDVLPDVFWETY